MENCIHRSYPGISSNFWNFHQNSLPKFLTGWHFYQKKSNFRLKFWRRFHGQNIPYAASVWRPICTKELFCIKQRWNEYINRTKTIFSTSNSMPNTRHNEFSFALWRNASLRDVTSRTHGVSKTNVRLIISKFRLSTPGLGSAGPQSADLFRCLWNYLHEVFATICIKYLKIPKNWLVMTFIAL